MNATVQPTPARKRLRVHVPTSISRVLIAPALPRLIHQHPELRLQISDGYTAEKLPPDTDASVCVGTIADPTLLARRVGTLRAVVCAAPDFIERTGEPATPQQLAPEHCIGLTESGTHGVREWVLSKGRENCWFTPSAPLSFGDVDSAIAAAVRGGGYIRVMSIEADKEIASGRLQAVLEGWNAGTWPVSFVHARDRLPTAAMNLFGTFVAGLFPSPQFRVQYLDERAAISTGC